MTDAEIDTRNVLELIAGRVPYLNPALRAVAELVLIRPDEAKSMTISELASEAGVADSTVTRFVKECGLAGYQALKLAIAEALLSARGSAETGAFVYEGISSDDTTAAIVGKVGRSSQQALRNTAISLDPDAVERAVEFIDRATVLIFSCMGSSSIAAENAVMRFTRAGKKCLLFRDQSIQVMAATIATPSDVLIAISDSGDSSPVIEAVRRATANGTPTIGITSRRDSELARSADVSLYTADGSSSESGLFGEMVTSKWGQVLVTDVLYVALARRHVDDTLRHLEDTYSAAIKTSRSH